MTTMMMTTAIVITDEERQETFVVNCLTLIKHYHRQDYDNQ